MQGLCTRGMLNHAQSRAAPAAPQPSRGKGYHKHAWEPQGQRWVASQGGPIQIKCPSIRMGRPKGRVGDALAASDPHNTRHRPGATSTRHSGGGDESTLCAAGLREPNMCESRYTWSNMCMHTIDGRGQPAHWAWGVLMMCVHPPQGLGPIPMVHRQRRALRGLCVVAC